MENGKETIDISEAQKEKAAAMKIALDYWRVSCGKSAKGMDYLD